MAHAADAPIVSQATPVNRVDNPDGFTEPLKSLKFNPGLDQREFERATLNALNVYDPLES
jgi:phospholipid-binding lipoprotein MlaA